MPVVDLSKEQLVDLNNKYEEYLQNFNYLDDIRMTLEQFYHKQQIGNYCIEKYHGQITEEELQEIKDKIDCIAQHFGEEIKNIEIDIDWQVDEFFLVSRQPEYKQYLHIEVVTREVAISNEQDWLSGCTVEHLNEINVSCVEDMITDTNVGAYHIMVGSKYYFRQM